MVILEVPDGGRGVQSKKTTKSSMEVEYIISINLTFKTGSYSTSHISEITYFLLDLSDLRYSQMCGSSVTPIDLLH